MAITTVFLNILLLSLNHLSGGFISSKSSGISHISLKGTVEGFVSEKKDGQDREDVLGFERIEPTVGVNTSEQSTVDKSHPYLVDDHHDNRDGWDDHDNDRHDHDDEYHHDNDRHDHDDEYHHDHDDDRDYHDHDHNHYWP